jgi:hypothetical protein
MELVVIKLESAAKQPFRKSFQKQTVFLLYVETMKFTYLHSFSPTQINSVLKI